MGARERVLKVGSKGVRKRNVAGLKFGVILGLYQFQNWGWGRIASSGKDKIARCVTERMTSRRHAIFRLGLCGETLLDLVVGHEATGRVYRARSPSVPSTSPNSTFPEEYPYTEHRYPSEWTNACFKSDWIVSDKTFEISCTFFKNFS